MDPLYFFELSGEHDTMPLAEAYRCVETESERYAFVFHGPGYAIFSFNEEALRPISERIALTHRIGRYLGSFHSDETSRFSEICIPEGSFSIRAKRFKGMMSDVDSQALIRGLGTVLSERNKVDLKGPDIKVRMHLSDKIHVFIAEMEIDRDSLDTRKVGERPFFSPISLHPKYARAAINLTGVKRGGTVLDPFCGTGGVLIEASMMGMRTAASDFDAAMVAGCSENMRHFGTELDETAVMDIGDIPSKFHDVDAVVTDPPYGRSTCTGGEDVKDIHNRAMISIASVLGPKGRACVVLPYEIDSDVLIKENVYIQKVHGSLSRYYHVFRKE